MKLTTAQRQLLARFDEGWKLMEPGPGERVYRMYRSINAIMVRATVVRPLIEAKLLVVDYSSYAPHDVLRTETGREALACKENPSSFLRGLRFT